MKKKASKSKKTAQHGSQHRDLREIVAVGGQNSDWNINSFSMDSQMWQNQFLLRARMRDLWMSNPYFGKYRETLAANIFGSQGIMLRMKIKETEDRVIHAPNEKAAIRAHEDRMNRIFKWACRKADMEFVKRSLLSEVGNNGSRVASIKVGEPDVFAIAVIQNAWQEWQRAEFCDVRARRNYSMIRQIRLWSCARDGDFFIRMVRDPGVNKFGFSLQMVNSEWCDYFYNTTLDNGNEVRMGIEYKYNTWGIGKPVAYYFIKRQQNDWQWSIPGGFNYATRELHDRVPAEEIIHYARYTDTDSTRPAPWGACDIPKIRQLDQYELAEVIAARAAACKTGWLYSDLNPEGGFAGNEVTQQPDPRAFKGIETQPGGIYGLPWGVKIQEVDPTHPGAQFEGFRKGMLRSFSAGLPAADYNVIANDLENINFSAGRLGRLDSNESAMIIQDFDIDTAERPIFEAWLEMALMTRAIPLPFSKEKFKKFNKPVFSGRRWAQVDEIKAVNAAALRIANKLSSRQKECAQEGIDFEENLMELAEEEMMIEELGLKTETTVEAQPKEVQATDDTEGADDTSAATGGTKKPAAKKPSKKNRLALADD